MFRNMVRSKEERQRDFEEFEKRMCPFGEEQLVMLREAVVRISQRDSDDPMMFYYYLTSADNYRLEREGDLDKTMVFLEKAKPKLSYDTIKRLLSLMELSINMKSLQDFPTDAEVREFADNKLDF